MRLGSWHSTEHWPWPGDEWSFGRIAAPRRQPTCASQAHVPRKPNAGGRTNCTFPAHVCNVVPLCLLHLTPTCLRARTPAQPRLQSSGTRRPRIFRHGPRLCSRRHRRIEATNRKQSTGQAVAAAGRHFRHHRSLTVVRWLSRHGDTASLTAFIVAAASPPAWLSERALI